MGTLRNADGTTLDQSAFTGTATENEQPSTFTVPDDVYEDFALEGATTREGRRLKWHAGQVIKQSDLDAAWSEPTFTSIDPATGPAAGGTPVTITGTNLDDATGATVKGVALTDFVSVSATEVTGATGAGTAGTGDVVVTTPAGTATGTGAFEYTA